MPGSIIPLSGGGQETEITAGFPQPLTVQVFDQTGAPLAGATVTFQAPVEWYASATFDDTKTSTSTSLTDINGIARSSTLTANTWISNFIVLASVPGVSIKVPFSLHNDGPIIGTYTMNGNEYSSTTPLPGQEVCASDGCPSTTDPDTLSAQKYATDTSLYYYFHMLRNGLDDYGEGFSTSVHYGNDFYDSFWDESDPVAVFGDGFPAALDVVAHELTHGVTEYGSNLYDYYQSGAIDESLSDIFGEVIDRSYNGEDNWQIGEWLPKGAIRSLSNPPAFKDPDKMTSRYYDFDTDRSDCGGVHHNSGINNKAAYLMMVGGTFNGKTVTALGTDKTLAIYYEVQMNLLTSGANYLDLYNALYQGCLDLVGTKGIGTADCQQVRNATDAVQMSFSPSPSYIPSASYCPTGMTQPVNDIFYDGFENGLGNWNLRANTGNQRWSISNMYASSGLNSLYGSDYDPTAGDQNQTSDTFAAMASSVSLPVGSTPYLYFKQAFGFEYYGSQNYDGGVLEYSLDNGTTWKDAKAFFSAGQNYGGTIFTDTTNPDYLSYNNPLHGRSGFVRDSHGYVASRYNLTSLAGKMVMFRWRLGTDFFGYGDLGWNVDDVRIYTCVAAPSVPGLSLPANAGLITTYLPTLSWKAS